jgi:hypothetical protein
MAIWRFPIVALVFGLAAFGGTATAQTSEERIGDAIGDLLVGAFQQARIESARRTWVEVDRDVLVCFERSNNVQVEQLIRQAISATDRRVRPYIQACTQQVSRERAAAAAAQARAMELAEQQRLEAEALAQRQEQERIAAEAAAAERRAVRRRELVTRYGAEDATAILAGEVRPGMSGEAVREALGVPQRIERVAPGEEMWTFSGLRVVLLNNSVTFIRR